MFKFILSMLNLKLTIAGKQPQSKQYKASFNDLVCNLELACFLASQGAERQCDRNTHDPDKPGINKTSIHHTSKYIVQQ